MTYRELDTVILTADVPAHGLKTGDLGAVVHVYSAEAVEVEFVLASGHTQAVITLRTDLLRPAGQTDLLSARRFDAA